MRIQHIYWTNSSKYSTLKCGSCIYFQFAALKWNVTRIYILSSITNYILHQSTGGHETQDSTCAITWKMCILLRMKTAAATVTTTTTTKLVLIRCAYICVCICRFIEVRDKNNHHLNVTRMRALFFLQNSLSSLLRRSIPETNWIKIICRRHSEWVRDGESETKKKKKKNRKSTVEKSTRSKIIWTPASHCKAYMLLISSVSVAKWNKLQK